MENYGYTEDEPKCKSESKEESPRLENVLHGIELKPGYVLEFEEGLIGVIFPTKKIGFHDKTELAIMYQYEGWEMLDKVDLSMVDVIRGLTSGGSLLSGDILWRKPEKVKYNKCFYNDGTKKIYKTLSAARSACKSSHVYRCWALGDEVKYLSPITCYSEQICTIKQADETISEAIEKGIVGVGFKDKRMC